MSNENESRNTDENTGKNPNLAVLHSSNKMDWGTPQPLFDVINKEFHLNLDVCATAENAKCQRYFTPEMDAFKQQWNGRCWMNPPYGRQIGHWLAAAFSAAYDEGNLVVCLVPARTDTRWWWDYARWGEVRFLPGRLTFEGASDPAPFPSAIIVFRERLFQPRESHVYWNWKV